ncbi:hypothetical protein D3C72_2243300 [compost metagenome]
MPAGMHFAGNQRGIVCTRFLLNRQGINIGPQGDERTRLPAPNLGNHSGVQPVIQNPDSGLLQQRTNILCRFILFIGQLRVPVQMTADPG